MSSEGSAEPVVVCHLGRVDYKQTWDLQKALQQRLVRAKQRSPAERPPHVVLTVEHSPVFTLGKSGHASNLLLREDELARRGAEFFHIDRGGDITYHGPGQIVVYLILDLDRFFTDIHRYLRELEEAVILTCADYGVAARRIEGRTGVWVGPDDREPERKICAMGIRCSRWVTMHGLAFNVNTDLDFFSMIVPCGIADRGVTSLARELERAMPLEDVRSRLVGHLVERFHMDATQFEGEGARSVLRSHIEPETADSIFTGA